MVPTEDIPENEKLAEEIAELKSRIKNTEYDLANSFKGNNMLKQKLDTSKETLTKKEARLQEITHGDKQKIQQVEESVDKIADASTNPISEEQENIIEEDLEEEFA